MRDCYNNSFCGDSPDKRDRCHHQWCAKWIDSNYPSLKAQRLSQSSLYHLSITGGMINWIRNLRCENWRTVVAGKVRRTLKRIGWKVEYRESKWEMTKRNKLISILQYIDIGVVIYGHLPHIQFEWLKRLLIHNLTITIGIYLKSYLRKLILNSHKSLSHSFDTMLIIIGGLRSSTHHHNIFYCMIDFLWKVRQVAIDKQIGLFACCVSSGWDTHKLSPRVRKKCVLFTCTN